MAKPAAKDWTTATAEATLTPLPSRVTRETIKSLRVSSEKIHEAATALKKLGFSIEAEGVVSITISGRKENFESVFQIRLEEKKGPRRGAEVNDSQPSCY